MNVGVALGPASGMVGIDVDGPGGEAVLEHLADDLPATLEFITPGGGRRLLYAIPPGVTLKTTPLPAGVKQELRFLGLGSQTVMPPSRHVSGGVYMWKERHAPGDLPLALAPDWMIQQMCLQEPNRTAAPGPLTAANGNIPEGQRNDTLFRMGSFMRAKGFDVTAIEAALATHNWQHCQPPLPDQEVRKIALSICGRYQVGVADIPFVRGPKDRSGSALEERQAAAAGKIPRIAPVMTFSDPILCSALASVGPEEEWIWTGFLERKSITMFSAIWKAGKTTLLAHLLKHLGGGGTFLSQSIRASKVLYVTEESQPRWAKRRDSLQLGDWIAFLVRPFHHKVSWAQWLEFLEHMRQLVQSSQYDLVVFDTISNLWPVVNENDAGEVTRACLPLLALVETTTLVLVHHLKKSDGSEGTGFRGSGAFGAFVDSMIELRRYRPNDREDRRRVLTGYGRSDDTVTELVCEMDKDGSDYTACGDKEAAQTSDLRQVILSILPPADPDSPGLTQREVQEAWPTDNKPGFSRLQKELNEGFEAGLWNRLGAGRKGHPYHYRLHGPILKSENDPFP